MGPTNVALVKLFQADQALREAEARLESASRSVRLLERRIADLNEKLTLAQTQLRQHQAKAAELELDVKMRDERINRLRQQQQEAKNHKEYQAFLTEINTEKVDKNKIEDEELKSMAAVEASQAEIKDLNAQLETEQRKHAEMSQQLGAKLAALKTEVQNLKPARESAAQAVAPKGLHMFQRLSERYDGEAMGAIGKPDRRREEYICTACHMSLVPDIYNRLHARDEPVVCPNCHRMLYIPDDLPPEMALNAKGPRKSLTDDDDEDDDE